MCNVGCAKRLLFMFNFVFWLAGALLLAFGIWMKLDPMIVKYLNVVDISGSTPLIAHAAIIFIVGGAFIFVIGFLGCCGAIREQQALLFVYAILLLVIMVVEITAAILVLIYRHKVESVLQNEMLSEIKLKYMPDKPMKDIWDNLQKQMRCCGAINYEDYRYSAWYNETKFNKSTDEVPQSCCATDDNHHYKNLTECQLSVTDSLKSRDYLNTKGCYDAIMEWFKKHTLAMMILGFVVGAIEIFGCLAACCLRSALKKSEGKMA